MCLARKKSTKKTDEAEVSEPEAPKKKSSKATSKKSSKKSSKKVEAMESETIIAPPTDIGRTSNLEQRVEQIERVIDNILREIINIKLRIDTITAPVRTEANSNQIRTALLKIISEHKTLSVDELLAQIELKDAPKDIIEKIVLDLADEERIDVEDGNSAVKFGKRFGRVSFRK